ncbi:MAG: recombination mediator RecR [Erysipelotrichaceae bacterium]
MYPKALEEVMADLQRFSGVGIKSAERYAFELLRWDALSLQSFAQHLLALQSEIQECELCHNIADDKRCAICEDALRDHSVLCVVSYPKDIIAIEKTGQYKGRYHMLGGVIAPSKGILPQDLHIDALMERLDNEPVEEVILAISPTMEGETTALYLAKLLHEKNIKITRIAHGIPMGGQLDYADEMTIFKAFEGRTKM